MSTTRASALAKDLFLALYDQDPLGPLTEMARQLGIEITAPTPNVNKAGLCKRCHQPKEATRVKSHYCRACDSATAKRRVEERETAANGVH